MPGMKQILAFVLALAWAPGAMAQAPTVAAPPPVPPDKPERAPAPDPWLTPPGAAPATPVTTLENQAAAVAVQEGLGPGAVPLMLRFYRPRGAAIARSPRGGYVFTIGEVQRVATETAFIDSYVALTGSHDLDRYRMDRPRPVGGIILVGGGIIVAYGFGEWALFCAAGNTEAGLGGQNTHTCDARTKAGVAVGGLLAAGLGLMMIVQSQAGADDPDLHRIPFDQADQIVGRYNVALLHRAALLLRVGDLPALMASTSPRPRPPAPPRLSLSPAGFLLTF
jgi:hypothetical protein